MTSQPAESSNTGEFLVRKCVFLLRSSLGQALATKIVDDGLQVLRIEAAALTPSGVARLSVVIEPSLRAFVGDDKARRLASALRVLVGGVRIEIGDER